MAGNLRLLQLAIEVLDTWRQLDYFHKLIEIQVDGDAEGTELMRLHVDSYLQLSKPYREKMWQLLEDFWKAIPHDDPPTAIGKIK